MFQRLTVASATLIAAIIAAVGVIIGAVIGRQQTVIILDSANATNTVIAAKASQAVAILQDTIEAPTATSLPTQTLYPTYTPYPTYTFVPSPTIPPTPSILLPFSDNFDNGINSNWKSIKGTWRTVNGRLIADAGNDFSTITVGDKNWQNYIFEVDVFSESAAGFPVGVIVRSMNGKSLMFRTDCCTTEWILINGTSEQTIARSEEGGLDFASSGFAKIIFELK